MTGGHVVQKANPSKLKIFYITCGALTLVLTAVLAISLAVPDPGDAYAAVEYTLDGEYDGPIRVVYTVTADDGSKGEETETVTSLPWRKTVEIGPHVYGPMVGAEPIAPSMWFDAHCTMSGGGTLLSQHSASGPGVALRCG
ncbi:hypothetical protein [Rhodococcus sp. HNM0569]|uniref:hypothetical protein n=1 Tax=Rhodococcus sp. HNM0569 TaxID=2716340 RepID=UPI00146DD085|nr:hypothetical protein [Rhodococcus sp. HNM0569]NLU84991.1 hypothetical protein [Rhodococcus sp. HNM0569]